MIGILGNKTILVATVCFTTGVFHSSFRHYFQKYSDEEDRFSTGLIVETKSVEPKSVRGKKK